MSMQRAAESDTSSSKTCTLQTEVLKCIAPAFLLADKMQSKSRTHIGTVFTQLPNDVLTSIGNEMAIVCFISVNLSERKETYDNGELEYVTVVSIRLGAALKTPRSLMNLNSYTSYELQALSGLCGSALMKMKMERIDEVYMRKYGWGYNVRDADNRVRFNGEIEWDVTEKNRPNSAAETVQAFVSALKDMQLVTIEEEDPRGTLKLTYGVDLHRLQRGLYGSTPHL